MKNVKPNPEFVALSEQEIVKALDAYEAQFEGEEDEGADLTPSDPVVAEVARLIGEYTNRFDEYCNEYEELPEEVLAYEPDTPCTTLFRKRTTNSIPVGFAVVDYAPVARGMIPK